ncbi:sodium-coupled monocarboxylate transporter 2-like [Haliotis rufescens]|uniref:sodium-coupled monocarboxylate transporter 2-like n=1 Tax=Haliotis rufescens TaxID=6454 RepID=UPI00201E7AA0|nr:sodium-coupled monocarboxylate transporter 2-like [Haliotis rufescens]
MKVQGDYSITTGKIKTFGLADYGVTSAMLVVSAAVGIFYVIKDRNRGTMTEYVLGGRHMHYIPVSMSLMVTFISALSLLGAPVEVYRSNTMMIWLPVAAVAGVLVAGRIFIPFFYQLNINNVFKMVHTAMVLYAPSLAVSSVTGLNVWALVFVFGSVTTLCTALGGMKAVLWTDTFQAVVMVVGVATLMVRSAAAVGGFRSAWAIADNRSRIKLDEYAYLWFSLDPSTRYSVWSFMVGGTVMMTAMYGVHQAEVQRTLSCSSLGYAQIAMAINSVGLVLVYALLVMTGVAMFAFYSECHPVSFNIIDKDMQLLPLLVMDILGGVPGLPGLIMSSILCGSLRYILCGSLRYYCAGDSGTYCLEFSGNVMPLNNKFTISLTSTVSSVLNALGTVIPDDFITPFCLEDLSDKGQTRLAKTTVLVCGVIEMCLAVLASKVGILFQAVQSVSAVFLGPTLGLFSLGMFCPWANVTGAICGFVSAFVLTGWIAVGAFVHKVGRSPAPSSTRVTDGCNWNLTLLANLTSETTTVMTTPTNINITSPLDSEAELNFPYTISFMYYQAIGVCVVLVVGIIVSVITGPTSPKSLDPRLICPVFDRVFPYLPEWFLKPLRFGIVHDGKYNKSRAGSSQMDPKGDAETFL